MRIPNYDTKIDKVPKRRLNDFLDEDFRMLLCGASGTGKTNLLTHMLRKPLIYYDKIYLYSRNPQQDKTQDLKSLMDEVSSKVGYPVMDIKSEDEIMDTSEYPIDNRKVVIFDDLVNAPEKVQNKIANHFTDGRHHNISPIYLTQSYYDVPQKLRQNCSHMALYTPTTRTHINMIAKENLIDPALFNKLKPYEFLFLNKGKKSCKKNFDENIIITYIYNDEIILRKREETNR